ncbi:hypothetical protein Tsubulata_050045, partial [Turnera subulata]
TICGEQHHKLYPSHQIGLSSPRKLSSSSFEDIEIPPRKLLTKKTTHHQETLDICLASPCSSLNHSRGHCCCLVCHSVSNSPTSTLLGMSHLSPPLSPSLSPPVSPHRSMAGISPAASRYTDCLRKFRSGMISYKDVLTELVSSLEAMNFNEAAAAAACSPVSMSPKNRNVNTTTPWIDASFSGEDQTQFILSPSTPNPSGSANFFRGDCSSKGFLDDSLNKVANNNGSNYTDGLAGPDPDLG